MFFRTLVLTAWLIVFSATAAAEDYAFDASYIEGNVSNADVALFNHDRQLPGVYYVDVLLNGEHVDSGDILFNVSNREQRNTNLEPCLSIEQLSRYGIKVDDYPDLMGSTGKRCANLMVIPQAKAEFQFSRQQLLLSIPQASMRPKLEGIAPEALWDDGISAFMMNYNFSDSRSEQRGHYSRLNNSQYMQLELGMNFGPWRLRNAATWQKQQRAPGQWKTSYTYAERGLNKMKSRLTIGERFTSSDVFDSVPFRGVMLASDDTMVPSNMRVFSPIVRGIARTQAQVEVKQNGYTIYHATVAPGPFALTDLATLAGSGDLEVTVWETDGRPQVFLVPWETPAVALKTGYLSYSVMVGQYQPSSCAVDACKVGQITAMYGLPWNLTLYGGLQNADHYRAASIGLGASLGNWGAISLDSTQAEEQRKSTKNERGGALRIRYSKSVEATNTSFTLTSYLAASARYNTLNEALANYRTQGNGNDERRKSLSSLTLSQSLGLLGYLNINGRREDFFNLIGHRDSLGVSFSTTVKDVSVSLNWTKNLSRHNGLRSNNTELGFNASVPLDRWLGKDVSVSYQLTSPSSDHSSQLVGLTGRAFDSQLNWNMSQSYRLSHGQSQIDSNMSWLGWSGGYGTLNGNFSQSDTSRQMGVDVAGGMVLSGEGITLAQPLDMDNAVALVEAPGMAGVPVGGWPGVQTDFRGYTALSYITPYQENIVSLDLNKSPLNADVIQTDVKVIPTKGAITRAAFTTYVGNRGLITLKETDGKTLPFGALVTSCDNGSVGIVDENGKVYLSGLRDTGKLSVEWGEGHKCQADYRLPKTQIDGGLYMTEAVCR